MPDPTNTTTTPAPTPAPQTPSTRTRSEINQNWLAALAAADRVVTAAQKPAYASALATGGIDAAKVTALANAIEAVRQLITKAMQGTAGKELVTADETDLKNELIEQIQGVQKRARQKYDATNPGKLTEYGLKTKYTASRQLLEQTATNILAKLTGDKDTAADTLPGITTEKIAALQQALKDYMGVQGEQTGAQGKATTARKQVEAALADILAKRREIQFAADAEWPHTNPANAGIRVEFQLTSDRVMK